MFARIALGILLSLPISLGWATPVGPEGEPGHRHPGKFIWFDLATDDPEGARAFYAAVFG